MSAWSSYPVTAPAVTDGESHEVLARTVGGMVRVAYLLSDEFGNRWVEAGQDGYELRNVVEWMELPA